ncbi:MAG TPA: glycosyltransferase family 39 protein [Candidatus Kryptonia bacterium]|nr:glycosyltransferase family 39 protein [Candidatus Kryptonia bacterium]
MKRTTLIALLAIIALATALRVYRLRDLPAGLYCDEAALGYNAYSLWKTGQDENGVPHPLFVWSFGVSYKNPVYIYAATLPIGLLGLDEFSLRLTSAAFGVGTVIAVFFLCRALFSTGVGLLGALALAICPWHLHFSRIAFELISFPFLFCIGLTFLVRFTQGRRTLPAALFFLGACPYAYAIAKFFVPAFLAGFGLLFVDKLLRHWRQTLLAGIVLGATVAPLVRFDLAHRLQTQQYFQNTTFIRPNMTAREIAQELQRNYLQFVSPRFLFQQGDELLRHAVRGHGELYPAFFFPLLLGAVVALLYPSRAPKLVLWWLALYPIGASLMTEIPSASRGFIGVVPFCILTALGAGSVLWTIAWIVRWRPATMVLQTAALAAAGYVLVPQVAHYLTLYFNDYPTYSAPTYGGFQYGYRDMIHFMEQERPHYRRLMMTATEVNQPYIFPLFYRPIDPAEYHRNNNIGYEILDPAEIARYPMTEPILYALREPELGYFSDYTVKRTIVAPGGQTEFVIAEVRARKNFLTRWMTLGLFDNQNAANIRRDDISPTDLNRPRFVGKFGDIYWRPLQQSYLRVDLNRYYASADRLHPGNPEIVCAYAYTTLHSPTARNAFLELSGSDDWLRAWVNGHSVTPQPLMMSEHPTRRPIEIHEGDNGLLVRSCESVGDWYFIARVTDDAGADLPDLQSRAELPPPVVEAARVPAAPSSVQVIEGFDALIHANRHDPDYPDYRGHSDSWREDRHDVPGEVLWRTVPCPEKKDTIAVFTASLGEPPGTADLWVNGEYALSFATDTEPGTRVVERDGFRFVFVTKSSDGGNSGIVYLTVPADKVTAGEPLQLRVKHSAGEPQAWFAVKEYPDTAAFEEVTPQKALAAGRPSK